MNFALPMSTRRVAPKYLPWAPHAYQLRAVDFLLGQNAAALFLDPGLGKTSIVLEAFRRMQANGTAHKMLVVAPLRVVQTVWEQEAAKWEEFRHFRFSVLHGPKKKERLRDDADIWLINPEGCQWLADQFFGRALPFDTVVIDELTKFKNYKAVRAKVLRPKLGKVARRFGLTGTPIPNGYMDLFSQFLMLDDGAALGKYITRYRDQYFQPDFNGFDYVLQPGAGRRIEERIKPYVLRMAAEDYLDLPPLVDDVRTVELPAEARKLYAAMKRDMVAALPDGVVTGANAAAVYSKLKQMANGAVYLGDGTTRTVSHLHDAKLDALDELMEELCGLPLLVAYEFNHDLDRLLQRYPNAPYIGAGVKGDRLKELVDAWNAGELPVLFAHPASAGHGLNLQGSGASHIAWLGPIWDLELYEQFIQRVHRQGTTSQRVVNHVFVARDTIDELVQDAVGDKSVTQDRLLKSLSAEIRRDADNPGHGTVATKENDMVSKLSRQAGAPTGGAQGAVQARPDPATRITPSNWTNRGAPQQAQEPETQPAASDKPNPFGRRGAAPAEQAEQRAEITRKLTPQTADDTQGTQDETPPAATRARAQFSPQVRQQLDAPKGEADQMAQEADAQADAKADPPKRTRRSLDKTAAVEAAVDPITRHDFVTQQNRSSALAMAIDYCTKAADNDVLGTASAFLDFLENGGAE